MFSYEICEIFKNFFFTEHLGSLLLATGAPYLVKLPVTFLFKKLNFIHQVFLPQLKKSFIPEKPFAGFILFQNVFQWLRIEKLKTTFHFLKEKKTKMTNEDLSRAISSNRLNDTISNDNFFDISILRQVPSILIHITTTNTKLSTELPLVIQLINEQHHPA